MSPPTLRFLMFACFSAVCLAFGYASRKRRWIDEHASRPIHFWTIVALWAPVTMLAFWNLPLNRQLFLLFAMQLLTLLAGWLAAWGAAKLLKLTPGRTGVLILCAALSNQGFTLGAYLCYTLFRPADQALGYAIAYVTAMQIVMVLLFYPIARHYGPEDHMPLARLMLSSFLDIRALPIHLAIVGLILNACRLPYPQWVNRFGLLDVMFYLGAAGGFLGIGLRLRLGDTLGTWPVQFAVAVVRFAFVPLVAWALLALFHATVLAPTDLTGRVLLVEAFMPAALNSVIIANLFHLDARLASTLWLGSTVIFMGVVLPVLLAVF